VLDRDSNGNGVFDEPGGFRVTRVSVSTSGRQANAPSTAVAISSNGRSVAFISTASTLVAGDRNRVGDVFVRDRDSDRDGVIDERGAVRTARVSVSTAGRESNGATLGAAMSVDGRFVAFASDASNLVAGDRNGTTDVFVRDRDVNRDGVPDQAGSVSTWRASVATGGAEANGKSAWDVSSGGRWVCFTSIAPDLVQGDGDARPDVFVSGPLPG
jgi:hypothetical protein